MYKITVEDFANKTKDEIYSYGALMQFLKEVGEMADVSGDVLCTSTKAATRLKNLAFYASISAYHYMTNPEGLVALQQKEAAGFIDAEAKIKVTAENMITGETREYTGYAVLLQTLPTLADNMNVETKVYCANTQAAFRFPFMGYFAPIMAHLFMTEPNGFKALAAAEAAANEPVDENKNEPVA